MADQVVVPRNFKLVDELECAEKDPSNAGISLGLENYDDIYLHNWTATIFGPIGTAFENRIYSLKIYCDAGYPDKPPQITFETKVNMECANSKGVVERLPILNDWKRTYTMMDVLLCIRTEMNGRDKRTRQPPDGTTY
eukprot:TRINITY_DN27492_c0_g1_i1.p3 TRINITY_DN27492_c0_g1~~TRINITY_DN27492_c0_g1_i1.p3  ORF type:complete len:138 (+),score=55.24 TRINITY_DN27492_c0_g1_i1:86-499(+)